MHRFGLGFLCEKRRMSVLTSEAVKRLWDEHGAALTLYARQWCDAPEDVVQDAFLTLVRQNAAPDNPVGWIYRVVRNRAINASKSRGRKARREAAAAAGGEPWFETAEGDRIDARAAAEALRDIPEDQRETIIARLWGGLSFDEISQLTGGSISTVHRCYQRGLTALRERLDGSWITRKTKTKT
jgi:RNA polymerase sigma factor (sigma-70 family)